MTINELGRNQYFKPIIQQREGDMMRLQQQEKQEGTSFAETIGGFVNNVDDLQKESNLQTQRFIAGEDVALHDVMIAGEKAKTSFSLLMELRNKALDLYREVIRIPV